MLYYQAFGLTVCCDVVLPSFRVISKPSSADIHIIIEANAYINTTSLKRPYNDLILLDIANIAHFKIIQGREIRLVTDNRVDAQMLGLFLCSTVFALLLLQRGFLILHASAVIINHRALIFLGDSGVGKSTLALGFHQQGYEVAADDLCAIGFDSRNQARVYPAQTHFKIWREAALKLGKNTRELKAVRGDIDKYFIDNDSSTNHPLEIQMLMLLKPDDTTHSRLESMTAFEKLSALNEHAFRHELYHELNHLQMHFKHCENLLKQTSLMCLKRPNSGFNLTSLMQFIFANNLHMEDNLC
ncbi:MAG: hypothetical protein ACO2ZM_02970 [Francisellaceae bacterium]